MRIAVMVSGGGTNLQALLDAQDSGGLGGGEITLVISSRRDAYALERAAKRGIQTIVLRKRDFAGESALDAAMLEALRAKGIGLIALAGYLSMLGPAVLGEFGGRILNVHPSLIPSFCGKGFYGLRVHEAALEYGVKITGATVHFVNEVYDGGRIVLQKAVEVLPGDTPESLQQRVMREAEWQIFPQAVGMFCKGEIRA
jgi:phosphoribosylglycinamide formyltransferase-1